MRRRFTKRQASPEGNENERENRERLEGETTGCFWNSVEFANLSSSGEMPKRRQLSNALSRRKALLYI